MATYTKTYTFSNGTTADGGQVDAEITALGQSVNSVTNAQIPSGAGIETSKTTINTALPRMALYTQYDTTNALTANQVIYRGWGITGDFSATSGSEVVTLPNGGFDDANYSVSINYVGEKATLPASITDVNIFANGVAAGEGAARSSTQFTASFFRSPGGNFRYVVYTWIAIGTKG